MLPTADEGTELRMLFYQPSISMMDVWPYFTTMREDLQTTKGYPMGDVIQRSLARWDITPYLNVPCGRDREQNLL